MVYITIIASIVILTVVIFRQLKLESPLLEFRVFKYNDFSVAMILIVLMFMLFIGNLTILPIYMQTMMKWSLLESGLILLPGGLIMDCYRLSLVNYSIKLVDGILSIMGMLTIMTALLMAQFSQNTTQLYVIISFSVTMLGNAMIMTPMTTQALNALPRQYIAWYSHE